MMENGVTQTQGGFLPSVEYDRNAPLPVFSKAQVAYVESISSFLSPEELASVRQIEWLMFNPNANGYGYSFVPGLRGNVGFDGEEAGFIYIRRFSSDRYTRMIDMFMTDVPEDFPKTGSGANMPGYRVTLPTGERFYPIAFFGDLAAWRRRLQESAQRHNTMLGHFDKGTFVISDGERISFGDLRIELLESRRYPKNW